MSSENKKIYIKALSTNQTSVPESLFRFFPFATATKLAYVTTKVQSPPIACHFHIDKQKQTSKQAKGRYTAVLQHPVKFQFVSKCI